MKDSTDIWIPIYIGDYLADTMHLTTELHGAYLLLIFAYWRRRGPLVDNDETLAMIVRQSVESWRARFRAELKAFFTVESGYWIHRRIDEELEESAAKKKKARVRARAAAQARWGDACSTPQAMLEQCPSPSPSPSPLPSPSPAPKKRQNGFVRANPPTVNEIQAYIDEIGSGISALEFYNKHEANGWVVGKGEGQPMRDWKATIRYWEGVRTGKR